MARLGCRQELAIDRFGAGQNIRLTSNYQVDASRLNREGLPGGLHELDSGGQVESHEARLHAFLCLFDHPCARVHANYVLERRELYRRLSCGCAAVSTLPNMSTKTNGRQLILRTYRYRSLRRRLCPRALPWRAHGI